MVKYLFLFSIFILVNCSVYRVTSYDYSGEINKEYITKPVYSGIGATIPDLLLDVFVLIPGLFYPLPFIESNDYTIYCGMDLKKYFYYLLGPNGRILPRYYTNSGTPWITFTDNSGQIITLNGNTYKVERIKFGEPLTLILKNK